MLRLPLLVSEYIFSARDDLSKSSLLAPPQRHREVPPLRHLSSHVVVDSSVSAGVPRLGAPIVTSRQATLQVLLVDQEVNVDLRSGYQPNLRSRPRFEDHTNPHDLRTIH